MTKVVVPDFFIIGAPKCGTTALASFLAQHHAICFSKPKEPHYFLDGINLHIKIKDAETYNQVFDCDQGQIRGEGSVWYLYSSSTIERINKLNPQSKMIVLVRDPIDLISSLHSHQLFQEFEDIPNINNALAAERERAKGNNIPIGCPDNYLLQYGKIAELGTRVRKVIDTVGSDRVRIHFLDDLADQPEKVYVDVLTFLGLKDDGFRGFARKNKRKNFSKNIFYRMMFCRPIFLVKIRDGFKRMLNIDDLGFSRSLGPLIPRKLNVQKLTASNISRLRSALTKDIALLESCTKRDLSHWKS